MANLKQYSGIIREYWPQLSTFRSSSENINWEWFQCPLVCTCLRQVIGSGPWASRPYQSRFLWLYIGQCVEPWSASTRLWESIQRGNHNARMVGERMQRLDQSHLHQLSSLTLPFPWVSSILRVCVLLLFKSMLSTLDQRKWCLRETLLWIALSGLRVEDSDEPWCDAASWTGCQWTTAESVPALWGLPTFPPVLRNCLLKELGWHLLTSWLALSSVSEH